MITLPEAYLTKRSTIGNLNDQEASKFLSKTAKLLGKGGGLLIGVDLKKDPEILEAAYNDASGVTEEFNKNILRRINRELGGNFDLENFNHLCTPTPPLGGQ